MVLDMKQMCFVQNPILCHRSNHHILFVFIQVSAKLFLIWAQSSIIAEFFYLQIFHIDNVITTYLSNRCVYFHRKFSPLSLALSPVKFTCLLKRPITFAMFRFEIKYFFISIFMHFHFVYDFVSVCVSVSEFVWDFFIL